jgi:hypothetical protein
MKNYTLILLLILLVSCKEKIEEQIIVCPPFTDEDVAYWIPFHLNDTLTFINDANPDTMRFIIRSYVNQANGGRCGGCEATREMNTSIDPVYRIAFSFMVYKVNEHTDYYFRFGKFDENAVMFKYDDATTKESFVVSDSLDQTSGYFEQTEVNGTVCENSIHLISKTSSTDWISHVYIVPYNGLMKFKDTQTGVVWERVI